MVEIVGPGGAGLASSAKITRVSWAPQPLALLTATTAKYVAQSVYFDQQHQQRS